MKILVIGGSYFFGRWFVQFACKKHEVTVLNRGNIPIGIESVRELKADRSNPEELDMFCGMKFDCIVDFCAYNKNDIINISDRIKTDRYIYISTVDVYKKGISHSVDENSPLEDEFFGDEVGQYIKGKVELEYELEKLNCEIISVRPGIIYGPANYAPRESIYFEWIKQAKQIIVPVGADGFFQFIYVKDAAKGLLMLCEKSKVNRAYNFCNTTPDTYESFQEALHEAVDIEFNELSVCVEDIINKNIPLPFPLLTSESRLYDSNRFADLDIKLTELKNGLKECYYSFK